MTLISFTTIITIVINLLFENFFLSSILNKLIIIITIITRIMKEHVIRTFFIKEHVVSVEVVSCYAGAMHQPLTMPNQQNCVCKVVDTQ